MPRADDTAWDPDDWRARLTVACARNPHSYEHRHGRSRDRIPGAQDIDEPPLLSYGNYYRRVFR